MGAGKERKGVQGGGKGWDQSLHKNSQKNLEKCVNRREMVVRERVKGGKKGGGKRRIAKSRVKYWREYENL